MMKRLKDFFKLESSAGILLVLAALIAVILKNSPLSPYYEALIHTPVVFKLGRFGFDQNLLHFINDGLMALFFLLVGLEVKREILEGSLSQKKQILLPLVAALGGVVCPAMIYTYFNHNDAIAMRGWAIPVATDIAFAIGILSFLGTRVPVSLKLCLLAIAIFDDLIAVLIIALFYTESISHTMLFLGLVAYLILIILNRQSVTHLIPYMAIGVFLWLFVFKSGVHSTLAGVLLAFCIPLNVDKDKTCSPIRKLEDILHPWVAYLILPLFAFANAGLSFKGQAVHIDAQPIALGIALGLFFGKQIGVMLTSWVVIKAHICKLPEGVTWKQYYGMALLTGIGFTMSLFIGMLSFQEVDQHPVRLGVIVGSLLSAVCGFLVLRFTARKQK